MNATCLHCHKRFPANDVVEAFPFATRVAYDPARLRYWVVCARCGKWSLAPLEEDERASTIEQLERWWRGSSAHYTAGDIGVGQFSPRFSVVRIGAAGWNEFASWRYARVLRNRRYRQYASWATTAAINVGFAVTGILTIGGAVAASASVALAYAWLGNYELRNRRSVCRIPAPSGDREVMRQKDLLHMELVKSRGDGWSLNAVHSRGVTTLSGPEGVRAMAYALPWLNFVGASDRGVDDAIALIKAAGGPGAIVARAAAPLPTDKSRQMNARLLAQYPSTVRIALEMATHEESERRVLENEIALLHAEWREAEEIAGIVDTLLVPPGRNDGLDPQPQLR